ncbi:hypothetical protein VU04_00835 [Desulfobulbus sp. TB]|nr:hypothetical protein [Desulfobulbus sp. TB]
MKLKSIIRNGYIIIIFLIVTNSINTNNSIASDPARVDFKSLPDNIITNISSFPVTALLASETSSVLINHQDIYFEENILVTAVDLIEGSNIITLQIILNDGSEELTTKRIKFDPTLEINQEIVYANIEYFSGNSGTRYRGVIVIDAHNNLFLGVIKNFWINGISGDNKKIVIVDEQDDGYILLTATHQFFSKNQLPNYSIGYKPIFSGDSIFYYNKRVRLDSILTIIPPPLPQYIKEKAGLLSDDNTVILSDGFIDLKNNEFTPVGYSTCASLRVFDVGFDIDPSDKFIFTTGYDSASGDICITDISSGERLFISRTGDYTGNTIFYNGLAYSGSWGNTHYGKGGISIIDLRHSDLYELNYFDLMGARFLSFSNQYKKIYSTASSGNINGMVQLGIVNGGTNLAIEKKFVYSAAPYHHFGRIFTRSSLNTGPSSSNVPIIGILTNLLLGR